MRYIIIIFCCQISCGLLSPQFSTRDYNNEYAFSLDGPCVCKCCCSQEFVVRDEDGDELGRILKEREFLTQDYLDKITDADFFGIEFPVELEVRNKAVLLIGLFVVVRLLLVMKVPTIHHIDFTYYHFTPYRFTLKSFHPLYFTPRGLFHPTFIRGSKFFGNTPLFFWYSDVNATNAAKFIAKRC